MVDTNFEVAVNRVKALTPSNDDKLQLYGLFKQATMGNCNVERPGSRLMVSTI